MMISSVCAVDSSNWTEESINGHVFKIPPQYLGGKVNANSYTIESWNNFAILCIDNYIANNYGFEASEYGPGEDLDINGHPASYFVGYNKYEKTDLSRIYFPVGNSIYCISWQSSNLTDDIREMVAASDSPSISSSAFYDRLDEALEEYEAEEEEDRNTYIPSTTTQSKHYGFFRSHFYY